jgi:hypothetical protein
MHANAVHIWPASDAAADGGAYDFLFNSFLKKNHVLKLGSRRHDL